MIYRIFTRTWTCVSRKFFLSLLSFAFLFFSCASTALNTDAAAAQKKTEAEEEPSCITLVFAGDIMAHTPNFSNPDFDRIWRDISPLVKSGNLSFANIEAPVADSLPWSSYPQFNMHSEYVEAAIKAGFNVFSLANNHTNDKSLDGIRQTKKYFDGRDGVWACGIKEKPSDSISHQIIEKNGWRVLFVAITEILNSYDSAAYIDFYPSTPKKREQLISELKNLQEKSGCDLFILSVHTDEPEYVINVTENHKSFFRQIIEECKADIIWANHPHTIKFFEEVPASSYYIENTLQKKRKSFIMYANGNTISAQRTNPQFNFPETARDYTGEGLIIKIKAEKKANEISIINCEPHFITTYITPNRQYVVKELNEEFIQTLDRAEVTNWSHYLRERQKLVQRILEEKK
ncbi:MAG: CapA family protein [Treponema sp.]|nr:CapA family protein [Treponema sp.]